MKNDAEVFSHVIREHFKKIGGRLSKDTKMHTALRKLKKSIIPKKLAKKRDCVVKTFQKL